MLSVPRPFSETERDKFRNLLRLAAESPFDNERENARAAAERMAERCGMTLEEAASGGPPPRPVQPAPTAAERAAASFVHLTELFIRADKKRREAALREAQARGLDAEERENARRAAAGRQNRRKMQGGGGRSPQAHARVLIRETRLPLREVATITGLDIYQVVGLKLKMRVAA